MGFAFRLVARGAVILVLAWLLVASISAAVGLTHPAPGATNRPSPSTACEAAVFAVAYQEDDYGKEVEITDAAYFDRAESLEREMSRVCRVVEFDAVARRVTPNHVTASWGGLGEGRAYLERVCGARVGVRLAISDTALCADLFRTRFVETIADGRCSRPDCNFERQMIQEWERKIEEYSK